MKTLSIAVVATLATIFSANVRGEGADIWGSSDVFHYDYHEMRDASPNYDGAIDFSVRCNFDLALSSASLGAGDVGGTSPVDGQCILSVGTDMSSALLYAEAIIERLRKLIQDNADTLLAGELEAVLPDVLMAHYALAKTPSDAEAALDEIAKAACVLEAALGQYIWSGFDVYELSAVMDELTGLASEIAMKIVDPDRFLVAALDVCKIPVVMEVGHLVNVADEPDPDVITDVLWALDEASRLWAEEAACSQAVDMYLYAVARTKANRRSTVKPQDL